MRKRRRVEGENRVDDGGARSAGERRATGVHLVEHYAEAENVGARVNAQPASLFWRHILRSAHYGAGHGLIRRAGRGRGEWVFRLGPLRAIENEVGGGGNLGFARRQLISAGRVQRRRLFG